MSTHHKYSPSKLETLERCPCFDQDQGETNEAAEAGTRQHEALETGDLSKLLDSWERDRVMEGQLIEQQLQGEFPNAEVHKELRVKGVFNDGSSDFNLLDFEQRAAVILDWKFGAVAVAPVDRNLQIWNYVLNLLTMYPEIDTVEGCIFQPKVDGGLQRHTFTRDMIPMMHSRIERVIERREDPNRKPTADSKACMYCNKKADCIEWQSVAVLAVNEEYGLDLPKTYLSIIDVPADQIANRYRVAQLLEGYIKQLKKSETTRAEQIKEATGELPPDLSMVCRRGNVSCKHPEAFIDVMYQIGIDKFFSECISVKASKVAAALNSVTGEPVETIVSRYEDQEVFTRAPDVKYLKPKGKKADVLKLLNGVK